MPPQAGQSSKQIGAVGGEQGTAPAEKAGQALAPVR